MAVKIEAVAFTDPRFSILSRELLSLAGVQGAVPPQLQAGLGLGIMATVWQWCTVRNRSVLSSLEVQAIIHVDGADEALVVADLAERTRDGLRIKGATEKRIGWKDKLNQRNEQGGKSRSQSAVRGPGGRFSAGPAKAGDRLDGAPPASASPPTTTPSPLSSVSLATDGRSASEGRSKKRIRPASQPSLPELNPAGDAVPPASPPQPTSEHSQLRAEYERLFAALRGVSPEWAAKQAAWCAGLLRKPGGLPDAMARLRRMFEQSAAGKWPADPCLGTLVASWDRFAPAATPKRDVTVGQAQALSFDEYPEPGVKAFE